VGWLERGARIGPRLGAVRLVAVVSATTSAVAGLGMRASLGTAVAAMDAKAEIERKQQESGPSKSSFAALAVAVLFLTSACDIGARDVDYRPSRGISADIAATHETDATSSMRGMTTEGEPFGATPWQLGQRHQSGP
jgi:hypothetical protein